jgi:hypothetical protein
MAIEVLQSGGFQNLIQGINSILANKVDKVTGKGLSTNDFTTAEKEKLAGLNTEDQALINAFGLSVDSSGYICQTV